MPYECGLGETSSVVTVEGAHRMGVKRASASWSEARVRVCAAVRCSTAPVGNRDRACTDILGRRHWHQLGVRFLRACGAFLDEDEEFSNHVDAHGTPKGPNRASVAARRARDCGSGQMVGGGLSGRGVCLRLGH